MQPNATEVQPELSPPWHRLEGDAPAALVGFRPSADYEAERCKDREMDLRDTRALDEVVMKKRCFFAQKPRLLICDSKKMTKVIRTA